LKILGADVFNLAIEFGDREIEEIYHTLEDVVEQYFLPVPRVLIDLINYEKIF